MELSSISPTKTAAGIMMGAVILFLYALFWVLSRRVTSQRKKLPLPPEADGAWPVIGHLHLLGGSEPPHKALGNMADAYGPIFTLKLGMHRAVVVSNWETASECFITKDKIFASRPKLAAAKHMGYDNSMFGFSQYGPFWHHMRNLTKLELQTIHRLEQLKHIRISEVEAWIKELYELCVSHQNSGGKKVLVEMKTRFEDITLNTIFRMVVGKPFSVALEGSGNRDYRKTFRELNKLFGVFVPSDSFPFLSWLDLGGHEKAMKKKAKVLDEVFDKWIKEHRQKKNSGEMETKEQDFMDAMLSTVKDNAELSGYDGDSVIKATCLALILAGFDTTATTMTWALSLLLNNQETLKKAQLELEEQVGRQRLVRESDIKNLIYLQAIVKETLRLYPAAPLAVPHESMEECFIYGYYIPTRTRLIVNLQKLQRDPLVWEEPHEFRPERFLASQKDFDVRGQNIQLIPFGNGRRMCLGVSFALQIMHLTLANLIHGFEIGRPSKKLLDMKEGVGAVSVQKTPPVVVLTPRLPAQVYE